MTIKRPKNILRKEFIPKVKKYLHTIDKKNFMKELEEVVKKTNKRKRPKNICPKCGKRMEKGFYVKPEKEVYFCEKCRNKNLYDAETGEEI